nr:hypothetical protein [Lentzea tibetensis]
MLLAAFLFLAINPVTAVGHTAITACGRHVADIDNVVVTPFERGSRTE